MGRPPDSRNPGAGRAAGASEYIAISNSDSSKHTRPRRHRSSRPPGPGELARARELRRRKLHLKLIEAWRL